MKDFFSSLSSPSWWVGVVIVGILINLISAYLKPRLDRWLSGSSKWWATRTEEQRRSRQARIQKLRESQHEQTMAGLAALRSALQAVLLSVMTGLLVVCLIGLSILWKSSQDVLIIKIASLFAALSGFMASNCWRTAAVQEAELLEARQNKDKPDK
jgi:hypothetical protein